MNEHAPSQVRQLADINQAPVKKSSALSGILVMLIFVAGVGVSGYAAYDWWSSRPESKKTESIPSPVTNAATSVAPTSKISSPAPTQKPGSTSQLKIQVLNGTGVAGVAAKVKDALTTAGYADVVTGNAPAYEYESTVIMAKPAAQSAVESLKTVLAKTYKVDSQKNDLDATSPYDVVVIIGKN